MRRLPSFMHHNILRHYSISHLIFIYLFIYFRKMNVNYQETKETPYPFTDEIDCKYMNIFLHCINFIFYFNKQTIQCNQNGADSAGEKYQPQKWSMAISISCVDVIIMIIITKIKCNKMYFALVSLTNFLQIVYDAI